MMTPWGDVLTAQEARPTPADLYAMRQAAIEARHGAGIGRMTPWGDVLTPAEAQPTPADLYAMRQAAIEAGHGAGIGLNVSDIYKGAGSVARTAALSQVESVEIESQITPSWSYDPNAPAAEPTTTSRANEALLAWVRPRITINLRGGEPIVYAPYGAPNKWVRRAAGVVLLVGTAATVYFVGRGIAATLEGRKRNPPRRTWRRQPRRRGRRKAA